MTEAASVTFTLYFLSNGLNQFQIAQFFSFFMIALALLEIPTGGFADTFGHKTSVALGLFFQSLSFFLFFLTPTYLGILAGMFMSALGLALQSGAASSLMYELLKKEDIHKDFQKIYGRAEGYGLIAGIIAAPLGSFVFSVYPRVPYFFSFVALFLAAIVVYLVKWDFVKKSPTVSSYIDTIVKGVKLTVRHKVLMAIVIIGIALTLNRMLFSQNINQPYLVSRGVPVAYIGVVAAVISAILAVASIYSYKISGKIGNTRSLLLVILLPSIAVIALGFIDSLLALPIMIFLVMGHAFRNPVFVHISHDEIDSEKRGTMASTISFLTSISVGLLLPIFGGGIDRFGVNTTLYLLGVFTFVVSGLGFVLYKSHKKLAT